MGSIYDLGNSAVVPPAPVATPPVSSLPAYKDVTGVNPSDTVIPPPPDLQGANLPIAGRGEVIEAPDISSIPLSQRSDMNSVMSMTTFPPQTLSGAGPMTDAKAGTPGHINTGTKVGYRHFTFVLKNDIDKRITTVDLNVNPEDLTLDTPYRVNTIQTMGGAFTDMWGMGVRRIVMRGHTGWRTVQMPNQKQDGFDNFKTLKELIFDKYHQLRNDSAAKYSNDELNKLLKLTLVDRLHNKGYQVVPETFRALRNKQRPLLHMYEVSFIVVDDDSQTLSDFSKNWDANLAGAFGELAKQGQDLQAKAAKAGKLQSFVQKLGKGIEKVGKTMAEINKVKNEVMNDVATVANKYNECVQTVRSGIGMIQSVADLSTLSLAEKSILWDTKSIFKQGEVLLNQVKSGGLYTYTGIVGSTYAPAPFSQGYGMPPIANTVNSFSAMKSSSGSLGSVADSISKNSQSFQSKVNSFDLVGYMTGKK